MAKKHLRPSALARVVEGDGCDSVGIIIIISSLEGACRCFDLVSTRTCVPPTLG